MRPARPGASALAVRASAAAACASPIAARASAVAACASCLAARASAVAACASSLAVCAAAVAACALASPRSAQAQDRLARAEDALWEGDAAAARAELAAWFERSSATASGDDRGRAFLLRARLADDPAIAERDYLEVVHGYPTSPAAPEALLRLAQWALERHQAERAVAYLDRLVADYPTWRRHGEARLWLARALRAAGRRDEACSIAATAALAADPYVARLGQREAAGCG